MSGANATTTLTTTGADPTCTDCQRYQEKYTFPAEYQRRICHEVSTAVHVRKACIWMRRTNPNTIDAFNAGRCFDQRRPIQERPESPCENGTAHDLLWRFQISQSIFSGDFKSHSRSVATHGGRTQDSQPGSPPWTPPRMTSLSCILFEADALVMDLI